MPAKHDEESVGSVSIVGRPNVGKSALFNRLVGRNIAIGPDQPGITRDRLSAMAVRGRRPFTVWDTGGIGGAGEMELTAQVHIAADEAMRGSDLILFVVDAQAGLNPIDQDLAKTLRKSTRPVVLVVNKIDHEKHEDLDADFARLNFKTTIPISAAHGRGITDLLSTIDRLLPSSSIENREASSAKVATAAGAKIDNSPLSLAIVGRPNAGKSSLINSILRDTRAIVSWLPATTRAATDVLHQ